MATQAPRNVGLAARRGRVRRAGLGLPALVALVALVAMLAPLESRAARARGLGLADMVARAERVFAGECLSRTVLDGSAAGGPLTEYVFGVVTPLKGVDESTVTFRVAATPDGRGYAGLPVFEVGERALLVLYPAGRGGRTSPLGLDQGHFRLSADRRGSPFAVNGRGNRRLFRDVPRDLLAAHDLDGRTGGPLRLAVLERLIRALVSNPVARPAESAIADSNAGEAVDRGAR